MFRIDRSEKNPNLISIFTGEICNLACTLCAPDASTRWQDELKEYTIPQDEDLHDTELVDFTGAISITFGGGEPVLNKSTIPLLKKISNSAVILIHFNCTVLPSRQLLDECARFDHIEFILSIDDTQERFNYLRWPANWDKVVKNILWMRENCPDNIRFAVNTVISRLNANTYHTVEEWINNNIPTNRSGYKTVCSTNESNGILNRFKHQAQYKGMTEVEYLDQLDQRRKTNWRETFPLATNIDIG
jgi:MoaA/NifB/PqqE/SkfB family radical SAM enzyme|tara:strand:- start:42 stop:779 length:738 start_codon:yes stop_codon:yes gene_type:complete